MRPSPVLVVTGHQEADVRAALAGLEVTFVHNPDYAKGLSSSLKAGIGAVPEAAGGALVLLGDMPQITAAHLDRLIAAFAEDRGAVHHRADACGQARQSRAVAARLFRGDAATRG